MQQEASSAQIFFKHCPEILSVAYMYTQKNLLKIKLEIMSDFKFMKDDHIFAPMGGLWGVYWSLWCVDA